MSFKNESDEQRRFKENSQCKYSHSFRTSEVTNGEKKARGEQRKRKKVIDNIDKFFTQFAIGSVSDRFFERSIQPLPIESYRAFFLSALP